MTQRDDASGAYFSLSTSKRLAVRGALGASGWESESEIELLERDAKPGVLRVVHANGTIVRRDASTGATVASCSLDPAVLRLDESEETLEFVGFSPDGSCVVVRTDEGPARLFDGATGAFIGPAGDARVSYGPPPEGLEDAALSPDGASLYGFDASAETLCARSTTRGTTRWTARGTKFHELRVACSPDGATVFARGPARGMGSDWVEKCLLRAHDARTGEIRWEVPSENKGRALLVSPDGATVWEVTKVAARAYATRDGALLREASVKVPLRRAAGPRDAISHDGSTLFIADGKRVQRIATETAEPVTTAAPGVGIGLLVVSPSGKRALSCGKGRGDLVPRVWDLARGAPAWDLEGLNERPTVAAFTPDERDALVYGWALGKAWDLATGLEAFELPYAGGGELQKKYGGGSGPKALRALFAVRFMALSPDGSLLYLAGATDSNGRRFQVRAHPVAGGEPRWIYTLDSKDAPNPHAMMLDASGAHLLLSRQANERSIVLDARTGTALEPSAPRVGPSLDDEDPVFATAPDVDWAFFEGAVWCLGRGASRRYEPALEAVSATLPFVMSPNGAWLATGADNGDALLWRTEQANAAALPSARHVASVQLSRVDDAFTHASFDAGAKTVVLGTARGVLVVCDLA